jgi:hypothetical protein
MTHLIKTVLFNNSVYLLAFSNLAYVKLYLEMPIVFGVNLNVVVKLVLVS